MIETKKLTASELSALVEHKTLAIRMPDFLTRKEAHAILRHIYDVGIEFYVGDTKGGTSERKGKIGPNLFRFKDDLDEYFRRVAEFDTITKPQLFEDVDVVARFAGVMRSALSAGARFERASDRGQRSLSDCTVRSLPAAPPHTDWIKAEMEQFGAVSTLTDQFAWNVYLSTGESGGRTAIYPTESRACVADGLAPGAVIGPNPGDLLLFRTRNVHEVQPATGDRITVSGFWGPRTDGHFQYWV
jgi:hypothetical protein